MAFLDVDISIKQLTIEQNVFTSTNCYEVFFIMKNSNDPCIIPVHLLIYLFEITLDTAMRLILQSYLAAREYQLELLLRNS